MRILVTGAGGLLGGRLAVLLSARHDVVAGRHLAPGPAGLAEVAIDLLSPASLEAGLDRAPPDAVVHCAALADADRCEREPDLAHRVNAEACAALARLCASRRIRLVALSTDLVFGGDRAWVDEDHPPSPLMAYGRTKLEGEQAVLSHAPGSAVARLALVCGRGHGARGTASEAVAWSLRSGRPLRLVTDQHRTPVDPESVAAALERLVVGSQAGRYHLGGRERLSRHAFGLRVARVLGLTTDAITPITQRELALGAPRPADVSLDSSRARRDLGWDPRPLDEAIREGRSTPDIIPT